MSLVVEDGTGLPNAEAYISVSDADAYFTARGNAAWLALDTAGKEQALRNGCDYMESRYRWKGQRMTATQALGWPRQCVVVDGVMLSDSAVPLAVARANAELAVRASAGALAVDESTQVTRETVGPITVDYLPGARQETRYAAVEAMLAAYVLGGGRVAVIRA